MTMLPLTLLCLAAQAPASAPAPDAALLRLLDSNGDGRIGRYEAAEAAMAWVDAAAGPGADSAGPTELLAAMAKLGDRGAQKGPEKAPLKGPAEADPASLRREFAALDADANRYLDGEELKGWLWLGRRAWGRFDLDADELLSAAEFESAQGATQASASFEITGSIARLRGVIDASTPARLLELVLAKPEVEEIAFDFAFGSRSEEAESRTARILGSSGLTVRIPRSGLATSGALDVFQAAAKRIVEPGAAVGVQTTGEDQMTTIVWLSEDDVFGAELRNEVESLEVFPTGSRASLRGLAGVDQDVAWATGSGATVLRTIDGGRSFANVAPASIEGLDVRDVHALSADIAWILTAGPGSASRILYTNDGGASWTEQHRETLPQAFLDGLDAWDAQTLIAYGDPMGDGRFRVLVTRDGGATWEPSTTGPLALGSGEASFAASGTGVLIEGDLRAWVVTGGTQENGRVFWSEDQGATWTPVPTPVKSGTEGSGIFSIAMRSDGRGIVVGGDFMDRPKGGIGNAAFTEDFGKTWIAPEKGPRGQRAGSTALANGWFLATGQTGTDISRDGGKTWRAFSSEGFHCVDAATNDGTVWFAGPRGRVARLR